MNDVIMPVAEAEVEASSVEAGNYELAYHVLPTVAEGEVSTITDEIKQILGNYGAIITDEENAARFELAYEIEKYLEGKYRRFASAYFGWIRFTVTPEQITELVKDIDAHKKLLRTLVIRLTRAEEANPFRFHEAVVELKNRVTTIDTDAMIEGEDVVESDSGIAVVVDETEDTNTQPADAETKN